jgi:AcrR family transcriptional regulator
MREAIYEATVAVLNEVGMGGLTMDRVAHQAAVAKGSLYNYFPTKQALLQFVYEHATEPIREQIEQQVLPLNLSARQKLETMVRMWLRHLAQQRGVFNFLMQDFAIRDLIQSKVRTIQAAAIGDLAQVVDQGIAEGTFRPLDATRAAELMFGAIRMAAERRLDDEQSWPINELTTELLDFLLHGLEFH